MTMVNFCAVMACGNRSDIEKGVRFFRLPSMITHQGEKRHKMSKKWRDLLLVRIHREDLGPEKYPYTCVYSQHFNFELEHVNCCDRIDNFSMQVHDYIYHTLKQGIHPHVLTPLLRKDSLSTAGTLHKTLWRCFNEWMVDTDEETKT